MLLLLRALHRNVCRFTYAGREQKEERYFGRGHTVLRAAYGPGAYLKKERGINHQDIGHEKESACLLGSTIAGYGLSILTRPEIHSCAVTVVA